jgi:cytochrome c peroxidase
MKLHTGASASGLLVCSILAAACSSTSGSTADDPVGEAASADGIGDVLVGARHFTKALPGTNGRSCATCHVPEDHFTLTPQHVKALYAKNPNDPLFNRIDADDPDAAVPTYNHLMAGLVRVNITLADNLDQIDADGNVITNADRTIAVWRGVPTNENVAFSAPYQYDGRFSTLEIQADHALLGHSQMNPPPSAQVLDQIADFELTLFSDIAAFQVGEAIQHGRTPHTNPELDPLTRHFPAGSDEAAGQALFQQTCAKCHGGPTTTVIGSAIDNNAFFPIQNADGTIIIGGVNSIGIPFPTTFRTDLKFPEHMGNYGLDTIALLRQLGGLPPGGLNPNPNFEGLTFPGYRIRFYTDATRTQKVVDMPPAPPGIGPTVIPAPYAIDPGRALITGNSYDWEGFKVLPLRGIAKTAPYFHDASAATLRDVLDIYSRILLPGAPTLNIPYAYAPEAGGVFPEAFSPQMKDQLIAFLQYL